MFGKQNEDTDLFCISLKFPHPFSPVSQNIYNPTFQDEGFNIQADIKYYSEKA